MKTLMRLAAIASFVAVLGFCVFGFIATFEPMPRSERVVWRTVYAMVSAASTLGLFRLLRCQCHCWLRHRRNQSRLMMALGTTVIVTTLTACAGRQHKGPYYYSVAPGVAYLSEEKAIAVAKETMVKEGYDLDIWRVVRSDARRRPDKLVSRFDPKQVRVLFSDGKKHREVEVVLREGQIVSSMFFGL